MFSTPKRVVWMVAAWALLMLINYYYVPFFILGIEWLGLCLFFLVATLVQVVRLVKNGKSGWLFRVQKTLLFITLLLLTFYNMPGKLIEKADWAILFNRRMQIVAQVRSGELKPNVSWNGWVCELPYEFPVVSNGGNDIGIARNATGDTVTVSFWVFRNFFDAPSTYFVYTTDTAEIRHIENKIREEPDHNWKLRDNWYRTMGD